MAVEDLGGSFYKPPASAVTTSPAILDIPGLSAGSLNADLVPVSDVSVFREANLTIQGTFTGTLTFQGSPDGTTFLPISAVPIAGGVLSSTATATGSFIIPLSMKYMRVRMTAYTSGTATGIIRMSTVQTAFDGLVNSVSITGTPTVVGSVAHDAPDTGNPVKVGGKAFSVDPTPVATGDRADAYVDVLGKLVITPIAPRAQVTPPAMVILSSTTETTVISAAGAGIFLDLSWIILSNTSATAVRADLRSATGGTVVVSFMIPAGMTLVVDLSDLPMLQATAANNWTIQLLAAVTDVRVTACAAYRKG